MTKLNKYISQYFEPERSMHLDEFSESKTSKGWTNWFVFVNIQTNNAYFYYIFPVL